MLKAKDKTKREISKMIELGRVCVKLAGRDAGKHCIVIDIIDNDYVMIDGLTRRKKCNIKHLEPLESVVSIKKNAEHSTVISELKKLGITTPKEKKKFGKVRGEKKVAKRPIRKRKTEEKDKEKKDKEVKKKEEKEDTKEKEKQKKKKEKSR